MLLSDVVDLLHCEALLPLDHAGQTPVGECFAADLMSEVLAFCGHGALLITGLANVQAVHTADVADLHAIVFVNGKHPAPEVLQLARERRIPLLSTELTMYEACGRLHARGLRASVKS
jgi:predicted transcriptional regulator